MDKKDEKSQARLDLQARSSVTEVAMAMALALALALALARAESTSGPHDRHMLTVGQALPTQRLPRQ